MVGIKRSPVDSNQPLHLRLTKVNIIRVATCLCVVYRGLLLKNLHEVYFPDPFCSGTFIFSI